MRGLTRRQVMLHLRNVMLSAVGAPVLLPRQGQARMQDDEHYFILVELKGGVHHLLSTDYPDPQELGVIEQKFPQAMLRFVPEVGGESKRGFFADNDLPEVWREKIRAGIKQANNLFKLNGYGAVLPDFGSDAYLTGMTQSERYRYGLGWAGLPLAGAVDEISVLRGVYMLADFHGRANNEIYSGHADGAGEHVAGVLSKLLAKRYGRKPLDNLVLDGAAYVDGESLAIKLSFQALAALVAGAGQSEGESFAQLQVVARSLLQQNDISLSEANRLRLQQYVQALAEAGEVKQNLRQVGIGAGDMSLNLRGQLDACLALLRSGVSRVMTVCMGQKNATNRVDAFGLFDAHAGLYHATEGDEGNSSRHHVVVRQAMQAVADFITDLKQNPVHASYRDKVTVVISSEFGRPANFFGNENAPQEGKTWAGALGNGHYYFNNNYIFFGKGVRRGVWLGESEPLTRYPYCVDFAKLNAGERQAYINPLAPQSLTPHGAGAVRLQAGFKGGTVSVDSTKDKGLTFAVVQQTSNPLRRAFMAKDVVKTILAMAGESSAAFHGEHYSDSFYDDAQLIMPLVG